MATGDIVPIELGLTDGDLVTLWAPRWRDGDDEWEAFLGDDDSLFGFGTVAEMVAFVRSGAGNDLDDHPSWPVVSKLSASELEPDEGHTFDLVGVPELAAEQPSADVVAELEEALEITRAIGEVCELEVVESFFAKHPILTSIPTGASAFVGREGIALWDEIGTAIADGWDDVLDAIDDFITTPDVDKKAVAVAEAELLAAAENEVDSDDAADVDDDIEDDAVEEETFWGRVGIDPIKIITPDKTYYSLRCYLDDEPIFLGTDEKISVFTTPRALARYLADNHEHDLATVSTYGDVQAAATDGSLSIQVTDENTYVLNGIADDILQGPSAVDAEQLDLAVELFTDAADYADDDSVAEALQPTTALGFLVSFIVNPDPTRLEPSGPFTAEADAWRELVEGFEARLDKLG
ncbi:MAG: primosomal protein [Nocardiaceae bacterium]|nr:primosomal protein [Nocardiaceae bacterium]